MEMIQTFYQVEQGWYLEKNYLKQPIIQNTLTNDFVRVYIWLLTFDYCYSRFYTGDKTELRPNQTIKF